MSSQGSSIYIFIYLLYEVKFEKALYFINEISFNFVYRIIVIISGMMDGMLFTRI